MAAGGSKDNVAEYVKEFTSVAKGFFQDTKNEPYFYALIISNCNGTGSWSFSDATIDYSLASEYFPAFMWYASGYEDIANDLRQINRPECSKRKLMLRKFINEVMSHRHDKCLKQLLDDDDLCEEKIKSILALHYFKPLSNDGVCLVDKCQRYKKCHMCDEEVTVDLKETTFGNPAVWYGQADILVQKSIVKIDVEDVGKLSLRDEEQDDWDCSNIVEVKTEDTKRKSKCQAIAQTIVNAFVEAGKASTFFDKFIPSFLATEKTIRLILYNCKLDKLLLSDEFPIWENINDRTLSVETMVFVWLTLNHFMKKLDSTTTNLIAETPVSQFKEVVGDAYEVYLKDMRRPCKREMKQQPKTNRLSADKLKFIHEVRMKLIDVMAESG